MATNYQLKPFRFNLDDLNFIRDQINFRPLFDANGNAIINWEGTTAIFDAQGNGYNTTGMNATEAIAAYGHSYASVTAAQGLREVTGVNNNLHLVNSAWGAVDQPFLQRIPPNFTNYVEALHTGDSGAFYANKIGLTGNIAATPDYIKSADNPYTSASEAHPGIDVVDYTPRMISQLTTTAGAKFTLTDGHITKDANGFTAVADYGMLETLGQQDKQNADNHEFFIGAINPGVAPANGWLALFGQFFDHGLDFIGKGADGTKITIPLGTCTK